MARTTVDDCLAHCPNHFELALGIAGRARRLRGGEHSLLNDPAPDRPIVQALREVASGQLQIDLAADAEDAQRTDFLDDDREGKDYQYPDDDPSGAGT